MRTQIKILTVSSMPAVETAVNEWLNSPSEDTLGGITINHFSILPMIIPPENKLNVYVSIIYSKETWR